MFSKNPKQGDKKESCDEPFQSEKSASLDAYQRRLESPQNLGSANLCNMTRSETGIENLRGGLTSCPTSVYVQKPCKFDGLGVLTSVLCSVKCFLSGGLLVLGGSLSVGSVFSSITHLAHSPWVVLPLVFLSFLSAFQGLVRPMLKLVVKTSLIKNKLAFFVGLGGFSSLLLIMGGQLFSGLLLTWVPGFVNGVTAEASSFTNAFGHNHDHGNNFPAAIVFDELGPLGLSEASFASLVVGFSHGLFFISSLSLGILHFLKILFYVKKKPK